MIDQTGSKVEINQQQPLRIISLVPSQTEFLFDLGLEEEVVGITKFCVHPRVWFKSKTKVGGTKSYHFDRIDELKPNLIIANKEENDRNGIQQLMKKYPVYISDVKHLTDAINMMKDLAALVNRPERGNEIINKVTFAFSNLAAQKMNKCAKRTAYFIWRKPLMVAGGDTFIHEMMKRAGFMNVYCDYNRYPETTFVDIQAMKVEEVLLSSEPFPFKEKHIQEFQSLLPNAKIRLVDGEFFSWYGSRMQYAPAYFSGLHK